MSEVVRLRDSRLDQLIDSGRADPSAASGLGAQRGGPGVHLDLLGVIAMIVAEQVAEPVGREVEQLGVEEAKVIPSANFIEDLNADSLDLVELIMALEEEFYKGETKLEISDEDAEKISTVQAAVDYIKEKGIEDA